MSAMTNIDSLKLALVPGKAEEMGRNSPADYKILTDKIAEVRNALYTSVALTALTALSTVNGGGILSISGAALFTFITTSAIRELHVLAKEIKDSYNMDNALSN